MSRGLGEAAKLAATRARERVQDAQAAVGTEEAKPLTTKETKKDAPLVRGSFYLSSPALARLDMAPGRVRQLLPRVPRGSINKSSIVEASLLIALDDLDAHGNQAEIVKRLGQIYSQQGGPA